MTEIVCPSCQRFLPGGLRATPGETVTVRCPECSTELTYRVDSPVTTSGLSSRPEEAEARVGGLEDYETVFQPRLMLLFDPLEPRRGSLAPGAPPPPGRSPDEAFLEDAADPGRRFHLVAAHTDFGGAEADVDLGDCALSDRHFRVEIVGREFFVRDLAGRLETLLNGRRIGYAELLAGDEIRAGACRLLFRVREGASVRLRGRTRVSE